jgi:ankyrin repeat protein
VPPQVNAGVGQIAILRREAGMVVRSGDGDDPNARINQQGWTSLHLAAEDSDVAAMTQLLQVGGDPNVPDDDGWTPLHLAVDAAFDGARQNDEPVSMALVQCLLRAGANEDVRTRDGETPRDVAAHYGPEAVALYDRTVRDGREP